MQGLTEDGLFGRGACAGPASSGGLVLRVKARSRSKVLVIGEIGHEHRT